jgi:RHS repeat-associated protein
MQERDSETTGWQDALDWTPNRVYSEGFGRWFSPDPLAGDVTNPQSLNRYAYVLNNPMMLTDPSGMGPCAQSDSAACNHDPHFNDAFGSDMGGSCYVDGLSTSCGIAYGLIGMGAAAKCPNNFCSGFAPVGNNSLAFVQFNAGSNQYDVIDQPFIPGMTPEQRLDALNAQLAATVQSLESRGVVQAQIDAFVRAVSNAYNDNGGLMLEGGNFDFPNQTVNPSTGEATSFNFGCFGNRCGGPFGTLDFSHNDGTFHLDTANGWNIPFGTLVHVGVDVFLGNYWYEVIPRPWPFGR